MGSDVCTFVDSLYACTSPIRAFLTAPCAAAPDEVRARPCRSLAHDNGTVRMAALQVVTRMCRYAANPLLMRGCASARDDLMSAQFRGFHSAALIMSELMFLHETTPRASCLQRYVDRGPSEVRYAATRLPPCRNAEWRLPFHASGFVLLRRVALASELTATVETVISRAHFVRRYRSTIAQVQSSSPWLTPFARLQIAYVEAESMQSTDSWRDHTDHDGDVHLYAWTKLRGGYGVAVWVAPFDRSSLMCSALEETPATPPTRRFQSQRQYLHFVYEHVACPVRLDAGDGILLSPELPHKVAEEAGGIGARAAWRA